MDQLFEELLVAVELLPVPELVSAASRYEQRLSAARLVAAARTVGSSGDVKVDRQRARTVLRHPDRSSRSVSNDARRAAAVAGNDLLGQQVSAGHIRSESIDALAKAADDQSGALPDDLVEAVVGLTPDQTRRMVDTYLEDHVDAASEENRFQQQSEGRRVRRYRVPAEAGRAELAGIGVEGPDELVEQIWMMLNAAADQTYRAAGGRDHRAESHSKPDHRRFDAAVSWLTGSGEAAGNGPGCRPTIVVTVEAERLLTNGDSDAGVVGHMVGGGPVSESVVARWAESSDLVGMVVGLDRTPLWMGRRRRNATAHQFLALAVRDRGCVLCSAPVGRCDAHHLTPWTAPAAGTTDLDNLALLCQTCHRDLHHRNHTLQYRWVEGGHHRAWYSRPATTSETPAPTPQLVQRE